MKRAGKLIEKIASYDNLRLAFHLACRGRRMKREVLNFRDNLDIELRALSKELLAGEVNWGEYFSFVVRDPKVRTIYAAPFRSHVAHHAMINVCGPVFERYQIEESYACRKGKGLDGALNRARRFARSSKWYLQMDIRKYFNSIDHQVLFALLERRFKDPIVLNLFSEILDTYHHTLGKGVPIGNLTSQYFANHYLAPCDHFLKEQLRQKKVVRYMDDFVVWSDCKDDLLKVREAVSEYLSEHLALDLKYARLNRMSKGLTFLGYRLFPNRIGLSRRTRDRFRRKSRKLVEEFHSGTISEQDLVAHLDPMLDFVRRGGSFRFRQRCLLELERANP
ncbi:MAG: RNA-directed DNA polymerase [Planctomycetota bacterium]|jgi:hypothetical protein|nr:RNA-directed DNA polymerase [Planctomycetota bacterium]